MQIMQAAPQRADDGARRYIILGVSVIAVLFGGLTLWSVFAPIQAAVIATGTVQVESQRKAIQHLEGGIVREIHVREGDTVGAGELLIRLEDTMTVARLKMVEGRLNELLARRARLVAERDDAGEMRFPEELLERRGDDQVDDILRGQEKLFQARRDARETEIELLSQRVVQLNDQISGQEAQRSAKQRQLEIIENELRELSDLFDAGTLPKTRRLALEREQAQLAGEVGLHTAQIAEGQSAIGETRMEIVRLGLGKRETVLSELRDVQTEISDLFEQRVTARDAVQRVEIRAPRSGRVLGLEVHTIGGVISPGQPIMHIVPEDDRLVVSAQVRPQDIDKVRIGSEAKVRFPAVGGRFTPEAEALVTRVSPDAFVQENGMSYYLSQLELTEDGAQLLADEQLLPGMPAEAFIATESRTAVSYLLKPLTDALSHAFRES